MALTTIKFETLLERNDRALERAGAAPETTSETLENIEDITARQRRRIMVLLARGEELRALASTDNQRQTYGAEQWDSDFVRLGQLEQALRTHVWKAVPNSRFKRFQELFSRPEERIVPAFDIVEEDDVSFRGSPDFNELSLRGCLVSPDAVSDDLAYDLHLFEPSAEDDHNPESRLRKKHGSVPRLKKLWESTVSVQEGHHRVLVIHPSTPAIDEVYGREVPGPDPRSFGSILYVRELDQESGKPRKLIAQHFDSVYGAYRKTQHEEHVHDGEIDRLADLKTRLLAMNKRLDREWSTPELRDELRAGCRELFDECIGILERCTNKYKIQARDLLEEARDLRDKRGRENITVAMSRMIGVTNRFNTRYKEMYPKGGYNRQDRMALQTYIREQENALSGFRKTVQEGAPMIDQPNIALFNGQAMSDAQIRMNARGLMLRTHIDRNMLTGVQAKPLYAYAHGLYEGSLDLEESLLTRDKDMAKNTIVRMHLIGKFQGVRSWFEKLKADMTDAQHISLGRINTFIASLRKLFSTYQVYPGLIVEEYREPFESLERRLANLQRLIDAYEGQDGDIGRRTDIYRELKTFLDETDIEEIAQAFH